MNAVKLKRTTTRVKIHKTGDENAIMIVMMVLIKLQTHNKHNYPNDNILGNKTYWSDINNNNNKRIITIAIIVRILSLSPVSTIVVLTALTFNLALSYEKRSGGHGVDYETRFNE